MLTRPKVSSIVASQVPEFVREDYTAFIEFLKAYYEYLESTQQDLTKLRDLDTTLDSFVTYFKSELASKIPYTVYDQRFLLQHIKDQYLSKGSEPAFKLLFRILFNKEVTIDYPAKQMLRASDGKWNQDVSIFVNILQGNAQDIVGKLVDVVTTTKIIRVLVDRRQYVEVEVDRAIRVSDDVYEFIIDRRFFGNISVGDRLRYQDFDNNVYFNGIILPTTSKLEVLQPGSGFKVGDIYNVKNFAGTGSIMKVSGVNSTGGITNGEFIKYGIGYSTDFTTTISSLSGQDVAGTAGTVIQRVGNNLSIIEKTDGFSESGSINTADYNIDASGINAFDGTYAGITLREFGISTVDSAVTDSNPAIIKCTLGPLAKYPGYYVTNDGFLDDAIFIQDSKFYQPFSYVIRIDETLETYKTAVKNLIHPAGVAMFGEYDIRNNFSINVTLESIIKILTVAAQDQITGTERLDHFDITKLINGSTLNGVDVVEGQFVTMVDTSGTDLNRTVPRWHLTRTLDTAHYILSSDSYDGDNSTIPTDTGILVLNPYAEAGYLANDSGSYVGTPTTFAT